MKKLPLITTLFLICLQAVAQDFWIPLNTPENFKVRSMTSNSHGVYFGANDGVYRTLDNGKTIEKAGLNSGIPSLKVDANDRIYAGSRNLHFSDDNGNTWDTIPTPECPFVIHVNEKFIFFSNTDRIYKKGHNDTVWTMVFDDNYDCPITSFTQSSEGVLFAGAINFFGYDSGVYRSFDEGETWEHCWQVPNYVQTLAVDSFGNIYAGCGGGSYIGLYRSSDMGSNWELVKSGVAVYGIAFVPDNAIYIGCSNEHMLQGGVFRSTDNGLNWELLITGMNTLYMQEVLGLQLASNGFLYASGYHILRSTEPVVGINNTNLSQTPIIYPNPVSKSVHVELKQHLIETVEIFDLQGKKIVAEQNNFSNHVEISTLGIPSGIYIVKVQHSNEIYYEYLIVHSN